MELRKLIRDREWYDRLFKPRPHANRLDRCYGLFYGIYIADTPQGCEYWVARYYWLAHMDMEHHPTFSNMEPMSGYDWEFLRSLSTPEDPFLVDVENENYV